MHQFRKNILSYAVSASLGIFAGHSAWAQEEEAVELETYTAESEVEDDLGLMPTDPVDSVFGFGKTLLETPRAVSSISSEMIEGLNISDIDDLVVASPGAFTQSFFGVAGALDVRGTAGEVYFRGMRRLDNPGNYPTPLGATDRIDIVRGPSTPIMGPSKIGGYINFVPKSARAQTGQYLTAPTGEIKIERGSWDQNVLTSELGGPGKLLGKEFGYYALFQTENSGSYYDNTQTDQNIYQASFNLDINSTSRLEFGGMYHEYDGNQVAGWNRLTQDLIDNGTYVTGSPAPLDTDGNGRISPAEYDAAVDCCTYGMSGSPADITNDDIPAGMALVNPGTTHLDHNQVLVSEEDQLKNTATTLYFDYIYDGGNGFSVTNKMFYDAYDNLNENAYGFAQFHDSFVLEEKLVFDFAFETDGMTGGVQVSPSIRHTDFKHGDDFYYEYFDRRDITGPSTPVDKLELATASENGAWADYVSGNYTDTGLGVMGDFSFDFGLSVTGGVRYDSLDLYTKTLAGEKAESTESGTSWTGSISYTIPGIGVTPYYTQSSQMTLIVGQGAELALDNVQEGTAVDDSTLQEIGVKGSFFDNRLYAAIAHFEQDRTDYNAQSSTTNESVETTGTEVEIRWLATESLSLSANYTQIEVINLNTEENGGRWTFLGAEDLPNADPWAAYGGTVSGWVPGPAKKAGIPETSYSLVAQYRFLDHWAAVLTYFHADETASGFTGAVTLPSYDLFNAGLSYSTDSWIVAANFKNVTDEKYYRSNFPNLFGSSVVLPEKPFSWELSATYKF